MKQKGFTLIELLVVITIIAVLSAAGLVSYQNAGKRSRDARRIEDLKEIQKGLEQYYAKNSFYDGAALIDPDIFPQGMPVPPVGGDNQYVVAITEDGYVAHIGLDVPENENAAVSGTTCNFSAEIKDAYCVVNLQ